MAKLFWGSQCWIHFKVMREFVEEEDAAVLDSLLDEAITSASQRCLEPIQMEDIIVQVHAFVAFPLVAKNHRIAYSRDKTHYK
eukprot:4270701-Amphidinium_carterae.1